MSFEWDANKNEGNIRKHGIRFADAVSVLEDEDAVTVIDDSAGEQRFVTIGLDALARILVVVYTYRGENIRIISVRLAERHEREEYIRELWRTSTISARENVARSLTCQKVKNKSSFGWTATLLTGSVIK